MLARPREDIVGYRVAQQAATVAMARPRVLVGNISGMAAHLISPMEKAKNAKDRQIMSG